MSHSAPGPWSLDSVRAAWDEVGSQREGDGWDERLEAWMMAHVVRASQGSHPSQAAPAEA